MQTNLGQIAKAYLGSAAFFTITGEGLMFIAHHRGWIDQPDYLLPVVGAFSIPALPFGIHLAARVIHLTRPPQRGPRYFGPPAVLASLVPWLAPQPRAPHGTAWGLEDPTFASQKMKYKEPSRTEFVFYGPGMASQITYSRLFSFCAAAWRRQQQVYYGNLASNKVFSREHFTKQARPRWPKPDYYSCLLILERTNLIINRHKGGELLHTPAVTAEEAMKRWPRGP